MIAEYKISLNNNKLSNYDSLLKKFRNWKQFQRDIKLTSLLESKRVQYDLEDIVNLPGYLGINRLSVLFYIRSMSFIINGDSIDELKITIESYSNDTRELGDIKQHMIDDEVKFFYR